MTASTDGEPSDIEAPVFDLSHFFNTDVAFFSITGNDGYFKRSNAAFERMLGWSEPELLAKSFYELIHPDDIPLALDKLGEVEQTKLDVAFRRSVHAQRRTVPVVGVGRPRRRTLRHVVRPAQSQTSGN